MRKIGWFKILEVGKDSPGFDRHHVRIHLRLSEKTDLQSCLRDELDFSSNFLLT